MRRLDSVTAEGDKTIPDSAELVFIVRRAVSIAVENLDQRIAGLGNFSIADSDRVGLVEDPRFGRIGPLVRAADHRVVESGGLPERERNVQLQASK